MAKTATNLASAIGPSDWLIQLVNKVGLNPGDNIVVGTETMKTIATSLVPGGPNIVVFRGHRGTIGQAAAANAVATFGPTTDWGPGVGVAMFTAEGDPAALQPYLEQVKAKHLADDEKAAEELKKKADEEAAKEAEKAAKAQKAAEKDEANSKHAAPAHTAHK